MTEQQLDNMLEKTQKFATEARDTAEYLLSSDSAKIAISNNAKNARIIAQNKKIAALDLTQITTKPIKISFSSEE